MSDLSEEDRRDTQPIPADHYYSIKCRKCAAMYVYEGRTTFDALGWPRTEARYAGWEVGLKSWCPDCKRKREKKKREKVGNQ